MDEEIRFGDKVYKREELEKLSYEDLNELYNNMKDEREKFIDSFNSSNSNKKYVPRQELAKFNRVLSSCSLLCELMYSRLENKLPTEYDKNLYRELLDNNKQEEESFIQTMKGKRYVSSKNLERLDYLILLRDSSYERICEGIKENGVILDITENITEKREEPLQNVGEHEKQVDDELRSLMDGIQIKTTKKTKPPKAKEDLVDNNQTAAMPKIELEYGPTSREFTLDSLEEIPDIASIEETTDVPSTDGKEDNDENLSELDKILQEYSSRPKSNANAADLDKILNEYSDKSEERTVSEDEISAQLKMDEVQEELPEESSVLKVNIEPEPEAENEGTLLDKLRTELENGNGSSNIQVKYEEYKNNEETTQESSENNIDEESEDKEESDNQQDSNTGKALIVPKKQSFFSKIKNFISSAFTSKKHEDPKKSKLNAILGKLSDKLNEQIIKEKAKNEALHKKYDILRQAVEKAETAVGISEGQDVQEAEPELDFAVISEISSVEVNEEKTGAIVVEAELDEDKVETMIKSEQEIEDMSKKIAERGKDIDQVRRVIAKCFDIYAAGTSDDEKLDAMCEYLNRDEKGLTKAEKVDIMNLYTEIENEPENELDKYVVGDKQLEDNNYAYYYDDTNSGKTEENDDGLSF